MKRSILVVVIVLVVVLLVSAVGAVMYNDSKNKDAVTIPNQPVTPISPVTPITPVTPTTPTTPDVPTTTPVTPVVPVTPVTPAAPVRPGAPTSHQPNSTTTKTNMTVYYIDVGQGDSELIVTPDNKTILIDTGPSSAESNEIAFIRSHTWGTIDEFVLTHPDEDHIGNAVAVMNSFTIKAIYHSGYVGTTETYSNFMTAASKESCPVYTNAQVHAGDVMNWSSSVTIRVMAINSQAPDPNDSSIVLRMTYGTISYLFMGDASSTTVEAQMVATFGTGMQAQILKVGHHGSSSATSDRFLTDVDPKIGVIEVGAGNTYGHPTNATLRVLALHNIQVFRTDLNGTVDILSDGTGFEVSVGKHSSGSVTPPAPVITVPGAPTNIKATAADRSATVSWSPPSNNGGAEITIYGIYIDGVKDITTARTSFNLSGLTDGVTYRISVTAINSVGESVPSAPAIVIPAAAAPSPTPTTNIVINEVESNPAGTDAGNEWVELYNPSDVSVDLSGWSVAALHGDGRSYTIPSGASIASHGYYVVIFGSQFLDNSGEIVVLTNAGHTEIDRTPAHNDSRDNGSTWQRVPNGADTGGQSDWLFRSGTDGTQN